MFTPTHYGLHFTPDHVAQARKEREREPLRAAWALLHALAHLREHVGHAQLTRDVVRS